MTPAEVSRDEGPVILGLPHTGTWLPEDVAARLNERGRALADTDWHVERLYAGLLPGATTVRATFHRYLIDANRDPAGASLYPGRNTTGLCPETDFDGRPIWREGEAPGEAEVERRRAEHHAPYHAALAAELDRVRAAHGVAILHDCHSIRSRVPFLFDGTLPDLNVGTDGGATCAPEVGASRGRGLRGGGGAFLRPERPVSGWMDDQALRPSRRGPARRPDGDRAVGLSRRGGAALDLRRGPRGRLRETLRTILARLADLAPTLRGER